MLITGYLLLEILIVYFIFFDYLFLISYKAVAIFLYKNLDEFYLEFY